DRAHLSSVIVRNIDSMRAVLDNLLELSELEGDARQQRHIRLPEAVAESSLLLREMAAARDVTIIIAKNIPPVEVPAAAIELTLTNLLANAIKYSDPEAANRWVSVSAQLTGKRGGAPVSMSLRVQD